MEEMLEVQRQVLQNTELPNVAAPLRTSGWAKEEGGPGRSVFELFQTRVEMWCTQNFSKKQIQKNKCFVLYK